MPHASPNKLIAQWTCQCVPPDPMSTCHRIHWVIARVVRKLTSNNKCSPAKKKEDLRQLKHTQSTKLEPKTCSETTQRYSKHQREPKGTKAKGQGNCHRPKDLVKGKPKGDRSLWRLWSAVGKGNQSQNPAQGPASSFPAPSAPPQPVARHQTQAPAVFMFSIQMASTGPSKST